MVVQRIVNPHAKVRLLPSQPLPLLALLLLGSCNRERHFLPRSAGTETTSLGIPVKFDPSFTGDRKAALTFVDYRASQWVAEKADWGCGAWSDEELYDFARSELVVIYGCKKVPGDLLSTNWDGYNFYGERIEIIYDCPHDTTPSQYDPAAVAVQYALDPSPLYLLKHELTHTVLGNWHP